MNCKMKCWKIGILVVVGVAALGWVVMALWNWLLPTLFGIKEIGYLQAMGVLLLSKILFGGFRGHCGGHGKWHKQRLESMTPEEREKFQSGMRGWCGKHKQQETEASL
jgi:hypothetical protein